MKLAGADEIYILGGVQAVTAMAVGTETIAPVNLIAGPGNAYVAEAKRQLFGEIGIDLFAGPTEILIVADDDADPFLTAVDLLSPSTVESPAVLITTSRDLGEQVLSYIEKLLPGMSTKDYAEPAWRDWGSGDRRRRHRRGIRTRRLVRVRTRPDLHRGAARRFGEDARLRGAVPGRGTRASRTETRSSEQTMCCRRSAPRATRGPLGRKVPPYRHLSADRGTVLVGAPGRSVRASGSRRAVRGTRTVGRCPRVAPRRPHLPVDRRRASPPGPARDDRPRRPRRRGHRRGQRPGRGNRLGVARCGGRRRRSGPR